jgi:hypothetical protein
MKKLNVFEWHMQFKEGWEDVQHEPRSGQPKTQWTDANVDRVWTNGESAMLFGSANKVTGICSQGKTRTLAWQLAYGPPSLQCNLSQEWSAPSNVFLIVKEKGKVVPVNAYGSVHVQIHTFLTSALVWGEWSASLLGRFTPGKDLPVPIV